MTAAARTHVLNVSGGKDSTAMYLYAMDLGVDFQAAFADVGNEHEGISEHWPSKGVPQATVDRALRALHPTGNPFLDACLLASGFPSATRRFCTRKLKLEPVREQVFRPIWDRGGEVLSWQGVRADESMSRSKLPRWQDIGFHPVFRPLLHWTVADVWRRHRKHGLEPNPLYAQGMRRVGCMPCIMVSKGELQNIARRWPEHIERIRQWERVIRQVSKKEKYKGSFFDLAKGGGGIDAAVRWSGAAQGALFAAGEREPLLESCATWGACE